MLIATIFEIALVLASFVIVMAVVIGGTARRDFDEYENDELDFEVLEDHTEDLEKIYVSKKR